ncbi:hypothetical protein [Inquilinus sp. CAU 1745]|uniref:hypothetical protein n=1 Tax=Inquilinus sp. CAU 1745 TaxID=3140369 RepID=UPI00325A5299
MLRSQIAMAVPHCGLSVIPLPTRAGHGAGVPLDKVIGLHADMLAFAAHWTGLDIAQADDDQITPSG